MSNVEIEEKESSGFSPEKISGKYLTFELDNEVYGIEILKVQEIIGLLKIIEVPKTPDFMKGVINLRDKIIPVIDLRLKFSLDEKERTDRTCIIVVQISSPKGVVIMGIIVDEVSEVIDIVANQIEPPPNYGFGAETEFIMAMGKLKDKVVMLLDINRILTSQEIQILQARQS